MVIGKMTKLDEYTDKELLWELLHRQNISRRKQENEYKNTSMAKDNATILYTS